MIRLAARGIAATWEPGCGHLPELVIDGSEVLHRAPWRRDPDLQSDPAIPHVDRRLGGTFACAPFGLDDADGGPPHGQAANGPWRLHRATGAALRASVPLARGRLRARIALRDGHPVLYQTHRLDLSAPCSFAHHPMVSLGAGGVLSTNATRVFTFAGPTREGTALYLPGQSGDGPMLETADGPRDWRHYPDSACDDFLTLWHKPGLGWTAIARQAEDDTIIALKQAAQLPMTGLWLSNGARQGRPWGGRGGVLGIEDGRFAGGDGFAAALSGQTAIPGPWTFPAGSHIIPHALVRLGGQHRIAGLALRAGTLVVDTDRGTRSVPFDADMFA